MSLPIPSERALPSGIRVGDTIRGRVTLLTPFGAFVDIGHEGRTGLVHFLFLPSEYRMRDLSGNVPGPAIGSEIEATVLGVHEGSRQIHLSMVDAPGERLLRWRRITDTIAIGDRLVAQSLCRAQQGLFCAFEHPELGWLSGRIDGSDEQCQAIDTERTLQVRVVGFDRTFLEIVTEPIFTGNNRWINTRT